MNYPSTFKSLNAGGSKAEPKPHKPCLLLAAIDMIAAGEAASEATSEATREAGGDADAGGGRIAWSQRLRERFRGYFDIVRSEARRDRPNPELPFYHLGSDGFWRPRGASGEQLHKPPRRSDEGAYAEIDAGLLDAIRDEAARQELRAALIQTYFPSKTDEVWAHVKLMDESGRLTKRLLELPGVDDDGAQQIREEAAAYGQDVRTAAFRDAVVPAYDFACAACGLRLMTDDSWLAQACHLIPWSVAHDDDPRNGIALCPNHHWAMDRDLIAPGPDRVWHVSAELDERREGDRRLLELKDAKILGPASGWERFAPREDALAWRVGRLG